MSILAGRLFLATSLVATVACLTWAIVMPESGGAALGLGVVAAVLLILGLLLFPRFVETRIRGDSILVRRVLGSRVVPIPDVREVMVLHALILPSRVAGPFTRRIVLRGESGVLAAFSTSTEALPDALRARGVRVVDVHEPLSASAARRRLPGSVSFVEGALGSILAAVVAMALVITVTLVLS